MKEKEIWKSIPQFEGMYQVSDLGRVKSLKRKNVPKDKILKGSSKEGYTQYSLNKNGKISVNSGSVFVAMAFLGHKPNGNYIGVLHIDNNHSNNRLSNLKIENNKKIDLVEQ